MKIYVNEMPTEPKKCLFTRKEIRSIILHIESGKTTVPTYYCNVDDRACKLCCGGKCNKLRVFVH